MPESVAIPLKNGGVAWVDAEDAALVNGYRWRRRDKKNGRSYAQTRIRKRTVLMHRFILAVPPGLLTDHRDRDGLNNRRLNIRMATTRQNNANAIKVRGTSKYKGVVWHKRTGKWLAQVGKGKYLGCFVNELAAALAYNVAAKELYGEFARLNELPGGVATCEPPKRPLKKSRKPAKPPQRIRKNRFFTSPKIPSGLIITVDFSGKDNR